MNVVVRHTDSSDLYTDNKPDDFRINLDLYDIATDYEVCLQEAFIVPVWNKNTFKPGQLYLYCDFVDETFVGNKSRPLLRVINIPMVRTSGYKSNHYIYDSPIYIPVTRHIDSIRFYIRDKDDKPVGLKGSVTYNLHFKPTNREKVSNNTTILQNY